jgi:hypothetical protein
MQEKERARLQKELEFANAKKEKEVGLRVYQGMIDIKELLDVRKSHFSISVRNCCLFIPFITHFCKWHPPLDPNVKQLFSKYLVSTSPCIFLRKIISAEEGRLSEDRHEERARNT